MGSGRLEGEIAIVTGSTSGLGRATAQLFAEESAKVVVTGRSAERGAAVVDAITAAGGEAVFVPADVADEADCERLVACAREVFGGLTVLVNNAVAPEAIAADCPVTELARETLVRMLEINVVGPAMLCKHAIPAMIDAGHGSIVNISATSGAVGTGKLTAYSASKGAIASLTRVITSDYGKLGVRCNTLQSGYIINEAREPNMSEERAALLLERQITRLASARDIALGILYLASSESGVVTGTTLVADGGVSSVLARPSGAVRWADRYVKE